MDSSGITDLTDRVCLVTGANRGIGLATSIDLARAGARVVLACRDPQRAEQACDEIRRETGNSAVEYLRVDLASQASIRAMAEQFRTRFAALDVLVNNAAIVADRRQTTVDGREATFAVNHLAYFLLTRLLLDRLRAAADGVVVNVAATNHRDATDERDLDSEHSYDMRSAYKRSKLANVSFTRELARQVDGSVRVNAFCPNVVATKLLMEIRRVPQPEWSDRLAVEASPQTAAKVAMALVCSPGTGSYFEEGVQVTPSPMAVDEEFGGWLWQRCSEFTGLPDDL
jgi:NAD(P)-dependent dehydrogenase (short-subunit alcohol dehydrogenase family)